MTTDTAAVALYNALKQVMSVVPKEHWGIISVSDMQYMETLLNAAGIYLQSWNHDMSQAPRDGSVVYVWIDGLHLFPVKYWPHHPSHKWMFTEECYFADDEITAFCHLMPPPKVGV